MESGFDLTSYTPFPEPTVLRISELESGSLEALLTAFGLQCRWIPPGQPIPGSYWGDPEAGLIGNQLYLRRDTPVHSALHEASHFICMPAERKSKLHTDAGGDYNEENAVCYLQILLADRLDGVGKSRIMSDMDRWGYTFRLGSARAWFEHDAGDAHHWLVESDIIDPENNILLKRKAGCDLANPTF